MPTTPTTKPVAERLQVKGARKLAVIGAGAAEDRAAGALGQRAAVAEADVVVLFVGDRAALEARLPGVLTGMKPGAIFWLAYPKLTSRLAGDLHRDVIHGLAPSYGLDVVSAIAIDADWSALRP